MVRFLLSTKKGFSLVEILTVLGLFSGIATLSLGALFNTQAVNKRLAENQAILDNANLSTQTITRDIRFGKEFYATSSLPVSMAVVPTMRKNCVYGGADLCTILIFQPGDASSTLDRVAYYVANGTLYKDSYPYGEASTTEQMTSDDVTINSLLFYVDGAQTSDGSNDVSSATDYTQPRITIFMTGVTNSRSQTVTPVSFYFETQVSPRELDTR